MRISFLGDIALNGRYKQIIDNPFSEVEKCLSESVYVIGNLECMVSGTGFNTKKMPRLETDVSTIERLLPYTHCKIITLAHNHCYDNLDVGFENTIAALINKNVSFIGAGICKYEKAIVLEKDGIKICLLNYLTQDTNPSRPSNTKIEVSMYSRDSILKDIEYYKEKVDHIVLLFHWGGSNEGYMYPSIYQREDAKSFIDAGASLIVGGHSHTLQPYEIYKGKHIYYSLGNFCFDDIICENFVGVLGRKEKESMILQVDFFKDNYKIKHLFIENDDLRIKPTDKVECEWMKRNRLFKMVYLSKITYGFYYVWSRYIKKIGRYITKPQLIVKRLIKR